MNFAKPFTGWANRASPTSRKVASNTNSQTPVAQPTAASNLTCGVPIALTKHPAIPPGAPAFCQTAGLVLSAYPECTQAAQQMPTTTVFF